MRAPDFWHRADWRARMLAPVAFLYGVGGRVRGALARPAPNPVPIICVGNLVAGGAGKTPVTLELARLLIARGHRPQILTRGYGGRLAGPVRVEPSVHDADAVGDEALLLAVVAPTWVAHDRPAGARAAAAAGADIILMDDGLQNPSLIPDLGLLVVDAPYGFGNGRLIPAGPLRESPARALKRVGAAILIGQDRTGLGPRLEQQTSVVRAALVPAVEARAWRGQRVLAFAGIGRPQKFFDSLEALGAILTETVSFPDHYRYRPPDILALRARALAAKARIVTTEKDWVRLTAELRAEIATLPIRLAWLGPDDRALIDEILSALVTR